MELLGNYTLHNIPVGAVNIDSQWQVHAVLSLATPRSPLNYPQQSFFNDFTPSPKITNLTLLVDQLHAQNVRVIFWATSMINVDCPM